MGGMLAIAERELRKFFHSPLLLFVALLGPLLQLLLMGNALGGKVTRVPVGVVDLDHGAGAVRLRQAFAAVAGTAGTFDTVAVPDEKTAQAQVASGRLKAAVLIPPRFTARSLKGDAPTLGLLVDNSDEVVSSAIAAKVGEVVAALNAPLAPPRLAPALALATVELYPYMAYMKFLLPGLLTLAIFISVMIGGGMLYMDDKLRGVHEGFLVTPISSFQLVSGMVLAGTVKAGICGALLAVLGSTLAGVNLLAHPLSLAMVLLLIGVAGFAFNALLFLMMGRMNDPMVPKILSGILNTLLFFPSGAIYPVEAFPPWMRLLAHINPMTYAVHGFRALLLKNVAVASVLPDLLCLLAMGAAALALATRTFKRTL